MMTTTTNGNREWHAEHAGRDVVAVRDTASWAGHPVKAGTMGTVEAAGTTAEGAPCLPGEIVVKVDGVGRIFRARDWDFPTSSELYIDSGYADHARFQLDGDGVALDLFTPVERSHLGGRRLNPAHIQDLLQWLADHGHTLDEGDTPEPEPAMQRVTLDGTHIHTAHFEVGDVVVEVHPEAVVLERKPKPEPVTGHGTAYVFGMVPEGVAQRRYHGFLRESGSFVFFDDRGGFQYAPPNQYDGFEPDTRGE